MFWDHRATARTNDLESWPRAWHALLDSSTSKLLHDASPGQLAGRRCWWKYTTTRKCSSKICLCQIALVNSVGMPFQTSAWTGAEDLQVGRGHTGDGPSCRYERLHISIPTLKIGSQRQACQCHKLGIWTTAPGQRCAIIQFKRCRSVSR